MRPKYASFGGAACGLWLSAALACGGTPAGAPPAAASGAGSVAEVAGAAGSVITAAAGAGAAAAADSSTSSPAGAAAGAPGAAAAGSAGGAVGTAEPAAAGPPTFTRVWEEVLRLKGCSGEYCHGSGKGSLTLGNKAEAYANLVDAAVGGEPCKARGGVRVKPGDPAASLLLDKLSHTTPSCGDMMPVGAKLAPNCLSTTPTVCTTEQELGLVRDWIMAGAKND